MSSLAAFNESEYLYKSYGQVFPQYTNPECPTFKELVKVITTDGRLFLGTLRGYDNTTNLILTSAQERIFDEEEDTEHIDLGVYVIRGDNVVCIGVVDEEEEKAIDWVHVHGVQLKDTKNPI